jgi:hypothetical protein
MPPIDRKTHPRKKNAGWKPAFQAYDAPLCAAALGP